MQRLKLAVWLQIMEASLADLSHRLKVSCEILREAGGVEPRPVYFAIRLELLFSLTASVCHEETLEESGFWSVCSPYHLDLFIYLFGVFTSLSTLYRSYHDG